MKKLVQAASKRTKHARMAKIIGRMPPLPEPAYGKPRPMTGFLATLSDEQKRAVLAYAGDDTVGVPDQYKV